MSLVEEEHEFRQWQVAHFGQGGVEFAEQPQQEGGVEFGLHHQFVGCQHAHHALATLYGQQVLDVEGGQAEEMLGALVLQLQQCALDGADGLGGDVAVLSGIVLGVLRHPVEHRAQVLQVVEQYAALVGDTEHDVEYTVLRLVQLEQAAKQLRAHLRDGGTHRVALLAEHVVETDGATLEFGILDAELRQALLDEAAHLSYLGDAAEVSLHIGHKAGHACLAECLGHHLQGDGLTCTCGTRDESVAVGHLTCDTERSVGAVGDVEPAFLVVHSLTSLVKKAPVWEPL